MPTLEAPCVELGSAPRTPSVIVSPSPSEISSASSPEPPNIRATPLFRRQVLDAIIFRALAMPPPEPEQPPGQDELERRLPGYRRIVIPRELTLIELLKQSSGVITDDEVLRIREAKLRVVAERVGLRRISVLAPRLRSLILDGSALSSLRDLGIGLIHLKVLSVNRCGLYSLDGVWGLSALREFSAAGNRIQDLQPLAALQKLQTLNLTDNPIPDASRLWTLGVCDSLRKLTLEGTPAADSPDYRAQVAAALPKLLYLDDMPIHLDVQYEVNLEATFLSDSGESDVDLDPLASNVEQLPPVEPEPGPSTTHIQLGSLPECLEWNVKEAGDGNEMEKIRIRRLRRRPATTECAGGRPTRPDVPRRPRTALERPTIDNPTRLQILNTLLDEEWRCSGSKLTSCDAVYGNLAHALRRPATGHRCRSQVPEPEKELIEESLADAARALAAEIPRVPKVEEWIKFKQDTGIDIDINFTERPKQADPSKAIERLEQIEKETLERFKQGDGSGPISGETSFSQMASMNFTSIMSDFQLWKLDINPSEPRDVNSLFNDLGGVDRNEGRYSDNSEPQSE